MTLHAKLSVLVAIGLWPLVLSGQHPSGEEILRQVDENLVAENHAATVTMIIHGRRGSRSMTARSWIQGTDKSFTEYLAPAREKGTKMLKIGDQLWMYSPQTDRVIRIAGHMLRQSMMGSDLSYEDMMEDPSLQEMYRAEVLGSDSFHERDCWVLKLTAKVDDAAYHSRKIWVDKERMLPLREDRFAKSGKLLKTTEINEVFKVGSRWYPRRITFKDALSSGEGTEFIVESVDFDTEIPDHLFTKASLRR
ncbi:MAG: outer membrane lipoprotein-sorting protein [Fidelibacterota bacterium]